MFFRLCTRAPCTAIVVRAAVRESGAADLAARAARPFSDGVATLTSRPLTAGGAGFRPRLSTAGTGVFALRPAVADAGFFVPRPVDAAGARRGGFGVMPVFA